MTEMEQFDELDTENFYGICSDCKRCYDMSFYFDGRDSCMMHQHLEEERYE